MADSLESVNAMNAKSKRIEVRMMNVKERNPTPTMSVFGMHAVSKTGHYTWAEDVVFGDAAPRKKQMEALRKKWQEGSTFSLSNMTVKKKQDKFNGCPHGWVLNLGAPGLKAAPLTGAFAEAIPTAMEPPVTMTDLTQMSTSQVVDFHAFVMHVADPVRTKDKNLIEVTLADATKTTMKMTFWEEAVTMVPANAQGKILYAFDVYLVVETNGSLHLTPRKDSILLLADGKLPKAKALLESSITTTQITDADVTSLSKYTERDYKNCPAEETCIADVHESMRHKDDLSEKLFEIPAALIALEDPDHVLNKEGIRIYASITISDFSGTTSGALTQEPALILSATKDLKHFIDLATKGCLSFSRGRIRLRRAPNKDNVLKLTLVAAVPRLFEITLPQRISPNDERLIPTTLSNVSASVSGKLTVTIKGKSLLATGVLAVVKATQEADTVQREDAFAIQNTVKDCLATGSTPKEYLAVTTAMIARLSRYTIAPGTCALVHVTNIENGALIVADMWQLAGENPDLAPFEAEIAAAEIALSPQEPDASPPPAKRLRLTFDEPHA